MVSFGNNVTNCFICANASLRRRGLSRDPLFTQGVGPTAWRRWQSDRSRELPSIRDRFFALRQIMHMLGTAIRRGARTRTGNPAHIDAHEDGSAPACRLAKTA